MQQLLGGGWGMKEEGKQHKIKEDKEQPEQLKKWKRKEIIRK